MATTDVLPLPPEHAKARTDSVVVELLMPATTSCVSCLDALHDHLDHKDPS